MTRDMSAKAQRLADWFGIRCHYCGILTRRDVGQAAGTRLTVDHIVPVALGGPNAFWNLIIACRKCNNQIADTMYKCFCEWCVAARVNFELKEMGLLSHERNRSSHQHM